MPSRVKKLMVKETAERYADISRALVAISYEGISAEDAAALRRSMGEKCVDIRVVRNRVARRAFDEIGRAEFGRLLDGEIAVIAAEDPVEASRAAVELAREKELDVKGGWAEGRTLTREDVRQLSALPPRKMLFAQIAALAAAPLTRLVRMIGAPAACLARALRAWNEKRESPGDQDAA